MGGSREYNSRHVERDEELEVSTGILSSLVRVSDLTGLPVASSNVEGEGINAVIVGEFDVLQPGILGVGVGVSHHMVGSYDLLPGSPLRNYINGIGERSAKRLVEKCRQVPKVSVYLAIEEWGQPRRGGPMRLRE